MAEKLEQLRALENGVRLRVAVTPDDSVGVDRPEDVARVEAILKQRGTVS
jgi:3-deoxy-manno-octulosonate cytidylyltransferase (CMP-KDO synthetase)